MKSRWSSTTKRVVVGSLAALFLLFIWRAGDIVEPFLWAMILSYILLPLVGALQRRTALPRTAAALGVLRAPPRVASPLGRPCGRPAPARVHFRCRRLPHSPPHRQHQGPADELADPHRECAGHDRRHPDLARARRPRGNGDRAEPPRPRPADRRDAAAQRATRRCRCRALPASVP